MRPLGLVVSNQFPVRHRIATPRRCIRTNASCADSAEAAAAETAAVQLVQTCGSWRLHGPPPAAAPRLLLLDGTNLAALSAGGSSRARGSSSSRALHEPIEARFLAWLRFLTAFSGAATAIVAFDAKGSVEGNVRAQLNPAYLQQRHRRRQSQQQQSTHQQQQQQSTPQQSRPQRVTGAVSGWAHLAAAVQREPGCVAATAAYGFEADDVIAAAAQWCRRLLSPAPLLLVASSDSDMQQLLEDGCCWWLELLQVASPQFPSGLQLHSAAGFVAAHSFSPAAYPDYLALVGKRAAGVTGTGLTAKQARTLLARFGSLEAILAAGAAGGLKPFGPAHKLLAQQESHTSHNSSGSSSRQTAVPGQGTSDKRAAALSNLSVLRMHPERQQLPEQQILLAYSQAVAAAAAGDDSGDQQQQLQQVAALHPARRFHLQQCQPYLQLLSSCLTQLGLIYHQVGWLSPGGLWCDLVVQLAAPRPAAATEQQEQQHLDTEHGGSSAVSGLPRSGRGSGWLVLQLLGPADMTSGASSSSSSSAAPECPAAGSYDGAVDWLAEQLAGSCGSYVPHQLNPAAAHGSRSTASDDDSGSAGSSRSKAFGHATKRLMAVVSGGAKRQLSLLKGAGWQVAAVPFYELHPLLKERQLRNGSGGSSSDTATAAVTLAYVREVVRQHF